MLDDSRVLRPFTRLLGVATALGLVLAAAPATAATLSAEAAADFDIAEIEGDFGQPTDVSVLPDGRIVIIQRSGDIAIFTPGMAEYAEARVDVESGPAEQGLLGVVRDPDFATNSFIYFYASQGNDAANRHKILRYKLDAAGALSDRVVVLDMGLAGPANHNGGAIDIYQGNMYIGVGDTGANSTPPSNHFGSCLNKANGKVLRISLAEATLGQPPADNPLVNQQMVTGCDSTGGEFAMKAPEKRIFAWGFRNPFRLWVDQTSGKVWVGDVGEETKEEISIVTLGKHYGYPFHEGTKAWNQGFMPVGGCMGMVPASECIEPAFDWDRGGGGTSIGGRILDGCDWKPEWKSRYVYGDYKQGKVWTLDVNATRDGIVANSRKEFASTGGVGALRMGTDNALYIVEVDAAKVSRVTAKGAPATANSCPAAGAAPTVPGGGGNGAGGGGNGTAGASNTAGSSATGGAGNVGTAGTGNNAGGSASSAAGSGNPGTAGSTATGTAGSSSSGEGGSTSGSGGEADDSGCGCRAAGGGVGSTLGLAALGAALGVALQRRRVRRS
jgi:glucose/arabinose dehydrogenase